jgi:hypothetical protein
VNIKRPLGGRAMKRAKVERGIDGAIDKTPPKRGLADVDVLAGTVAKVDQWMLEPSPITASVPETVRMPARSPCR